MPLYSENQTPLSPHLKEFINRYQVYLNEVKKPLEGVLKIHVDEIATAIASFYEKIRNIVDYREEHLLRKRTIERTFKRRILLRETNRNFAEPLIKEIIRAGHLPNDTIPETKIKEVQKIIDKYIFLIETIENSPKFEGDTFNWLLEIGACEIEETLDPPIKDNLLASLMYQVLKNNLVVKDDKIDERTKEIQIFINIQLALLRVDKSQLQYRLLKFLYPNWKELEIKDLPKTAEEINSLKKEIKSYINSPFRRSFFKICNKYNTIFYLISDITFKSQNPEELKNIFENEETFEKTIKSAYQKRYSKEKIKLTRLAFLSVISFFLSKILTAFAIEIPLDKYFLHTFSWFNVILSIIIPPLLMLIIILTIKMPSEKNLKIVLEEAKAVVYVNKTKNYILKIPPKKSLLATISVNLFYILMFFITFGLLLKLLLKIHFSLASSIIFLFFISMVAATGVKAYNRSKELSLEEEKSNILTFLIDLFSLPLITVGKWIGYGLERFNILIIIFDLAIELPLQVFIIFLENLNSFIKSKKEELY
jgi:hypothetical protein